MSLVDKNSQSVEHANLGSSHSHFDLREIFAGGYRFGEISPTYCERVVPDDKNATFQSSTDVRSLNLKSPLMQDVKLIKDYFQVPKSAILPLNWEKIEKMPNIGDDVVASNVNTTIEEFNLSLEYILQVYHAIIALVTSNANSGGDSWLKWDKTALAVMFRFLTWCKSIFSSGSLTTQLGTPIDAFCKAYYSRLPFDLEYDILIDKFVKVISDSSCHLYVKFPNQDKMIVLNSFDESDADVWYDNVGNSFVAITFRRFLELIRDEPDFTLNIAADSNDAETTLTVALASYLSGIGQYFILTGVKNSQPYFDLNIDSLAAYQLCCAHFYTNDKVDFVYSAELYRQNLRDAASVVTSLTDGDGFLSDVRFTYNGQSYLYDEFSAYKVKYIINACCDKITDTFSSDEPDYLDIRPVEVALLNYWNLIFNIRNSLRYMDYFVGAKTRPLAITDKTNVPVVANQVSMVNVAIGKAYSKLALAVGRIGRKTEKYMREVLHVEQHRDYHNPWYLANVVDKVGSYETENTAINPETATSSDVQTTISNIRSNSNRYAFDIDVDCESIILCLMSFDMERIYTRASTRFNRHIDRYDGFIPQLQFIGDQEVWSQEVDITTSSTYKFGYRERNAEYKEKVSRAFGPFSIKGVLPGWLMIANDRVTAGGNVSLSPSFIRSYPYEFDQFYISLTGKSDATYFHFIVKNTNYLSVDRPMIAKPTIF